MYVGYLLDKESGMYHQGPVRRSSINLPPQNFVSTPQYTDFTGYHHVPSMDTHAQSAGSWGPTYAAPREDWGAYSLGPPNTIPTPMNNSSPGQVPYCSSEYSHMHPPSSAVLQPPPENVTAAQLSPERERRNSYQWMSKTAQSSSTGQFTILYYIPRYNMERAAWKTSGFVRARFLFGFLSDFSRMCYFSDCSMLFKIHFLIEFL